MLHDAIRRLNPWWRDLGDRLPGPALRPRYLQSRIQQRLNARLDRRALVILGPRQVGKSTILRQCIDDLLDNGVPPQNIVHFDFDVDRQPLPSPDPWELMDLLPPIDGRLPRFVFFDEFGKVPNWDRWLKSAVDREAAKFIVTDSSASLLRAGTRESGAGRWDEFILEPLTFREFVELQGRRDETFEDARDRLGMTLLIERYLRIGGFPEHALLEGGAIHPQEVQARLRADVADRVIGRDLAAFGIDLPRARALLIYLLRDSGAVFSDTERSRDLGATRISVSNWLDYLEDTLLVQRLDRFHRRATAALRSKPKIYAADHGLIGAFSLLDPDEPGLRAKVFEAVTFRHLREVVGPGEGGLRYLKTGKAEVDFLLELGGMRVLIEVTSSRPPQPKKLATLRKAAKDLGASASYLLHGGAPLGPESIPDDGDVQVISLVEFLQDPSIIGARGET
jgi:hypothetical protein